ncbi:hypothetical protein EVC12_033 [Rhizobium phage RHph_I42]|nr:hypothetical protein EVC12_033 [Rhizobium phage RHph_I42]
MNEDRRPVAIWTEEDAKPYYAASRECQDAWNAYADHEAQVEMNCMDPDRQPGTMYHWQPPFTFAQFKNAFDKGLAGRLRRPLNYYDPSRDYLTTRGDKEHLTPHEIDYLTTPGPIPAPASIVKPVSENVVKVETALLKRGKSRSVVPMEAAKDLAYETAKQHIRMEIASIRLDIARQKPSVWSLFRTRSTTNAEDALKRLEKRLDSM